ncbi:hypothetical protein OM076_13695 [Solirubrobacter ginsenosidimutans]|uniref:Uncharacterized protein n=1 Tax=Solirubrobacter ginsenosidimutans TaxID=490573 RepID=A0A9X3S2N1_9ACTN|nr:hypothetical protein [Solirubrobacter ginsenosidimutans]MDA0161326.1 hypothetical protein [Solirubrobacter ginsenosidimutans]
MTWGEIVTALAVDDGVEAYLDWATGLLRINRAYDEWRQETPSHVFAETLAHESFHLVQLATTGYGYRLSARLFDLVRRALTATADVEIPPGASAEVARLLSVLDAVGPEGVTARSVLESHAYLVQKQAVWTGLTAASYDAILVSAPAPEYRTAYEFARDHLADETFTTFPLLCSLALLTADPAETFIALVHELDRRSLHYEPGTARALLGLTEALAGRFLGTAADVRRAQGLRHPLLDPLLDAVDHRRASGGVDPIEGLAQPLALYAAIAFKTLRPMLFNPTLRPDGGPQLPLHLPEAVWAEFAPEQRDATARAVMLVAAASAAMFGAAPIERAHPATVPVAAPTRPARRMMRVDVTDAEVKRLDVDRLVAIFSDPSVIGSWRGLQGQIVLAFPGYGVDDEDPPYLHPDVRRFLRHAFDRIPTLLYFLPPDPEYGVLLAFLSVHSPSEASTMVGTQLGVQPSAEAIETLEAQLRSVARLADTLGDDADAIVRALVAPLGPAAAAALASG